MAFSPSVKECGRNGGKMYVRPDAYFAGETGPRNGHQSDNNPTVTTARTTQPQSGFCSINNPTEINRLMRTVGSATDPETKSQLAVPISTTQKDSAKEQARPMARYISAAIQKSSRDM